MKGRNIVIGLIITCITIGSCIALAVQKSGTQLIASYKESNPVEVSFEAPRNRPNQNAEASSVSALTVSDIKKYANSAYVTSYYYTLETTLSSNQLSAISSDDNDKDNEETIKNSDERRPIGNMGDYRITAYSDSSYISEFTSGNKKMIDGSMFTIKDTGSKIIISDELAEANDIKVGDEVIFYLPNADDKTYTFTVTGLYEVTSEDNEFSFMKMNAMNSSNQIYTTIEVMEKILDTTEDSLGPNEGLNARFYLKKVSDVDAFTKEAQTKGLDSNYQVRTNEQELMASLTPIEQISKFGLTFLIVILIVGAVILSVINLLHIRERKYEIGVLRSIGMSKWKVSFQIISEIFIVSIFALIIGTGIGIVTAEPVANYMLEKQIESTENKASTLAENFGSDKFGSRPGMMQEQRGMNKDITYVDHIDISIGLTTITSLFGFSLLLVITSSFISIMNINKYEPNKILQSRN